jgi:hypothetical protein
MRADMHEISPDSRTTKAMLGGTTLLLLEIVIPVALANLVEALTMTGYLPEFSLLDLPLYWWGLAACALWVLVVLNCGPILAPGRSERRRKE